jgi:hypothetical protein
MFRILLVSALFSVAPAAAKPTKINLEESVKWQRTANGAKTRRAAIQKIADYSQFRLDAIANGPTAGSSSTQDARQYYTTMRAKALQELGK